MSLENKCILWEIPEEIRYRLLRCGVRITRWKTWSVISNGAYTRRSYKCEGCNLILKILSKSWNFNVKDLYFDMQYNTYPRAHKDDFLKINAWICTKKDSVWILRYLPHFSNGSIKKTSTTHILSGHIIFSSSLTIHYKKYKFSSHSHSQNPHLRCTPAICTLCFE